VLLANRQQLIFGLWQTMSYLTEEPPDLPWHSHEAAVEIMPQPQQEPHPVVLATLSPSVALRAVWRRPRAG